MNKEEINVDIMSSEELEDFEYLIQNYSKSKLAYKIIKIEEESKSYYNANFELQQENKQLKEELSEWDKIFDTFSKRKYAHRYLEERRKENPNLLCPDSDEIYQKYYELKDNWNKLKEILPNVSKHYKNQFQLFSANCCEHILEIMEELEKGDSDE